MFHVCGSTEFSTYQHFAWTPPAPGSPRSCVNEVISGTRVVFIIAAFGMLILLPQLAWHGLRFEAREQTSFTNPSLTATFAIQPRIVWILMDELSYDQVFEDRPSGLTFPHFEQFAQ